MQDKFSRMGTDKPTTKVTTCPLPTFREGWRENTKVGRGGNCYSDAAGIIGLGGTQRKDLVAAQVLWAAAFGPDVVANGTRGMPPVFARIAAATDDGFDAFFPHRVDGTHFGRTIPQGQPAATARRGVGLRSVCKHVGMQRNLACLEIVRERFAHIIDADNFLIQDDRTIGVLPADVLWMVVLESLTEVPDRFPLTVRPPGLGLRLTEPVSLVLALPTAFPTTV